MTSSCPGRPAAVVDGLEQVLRLLVDALGLVVVRSLIALLGEKPDLLLIGLLLRLQLLEELVDRARDGLLVARDHARREDRGIPFLQNEVAVIPEGEQIGRASCRERV